MVKSSSGNLPFQWQGQDLLLWISVQPRSSHNAIGDIHDGKLRIRLTASPVDGKANQALSKLLSKTFGVSVSQISIEKGETSKSKRVRICAPKSLPQLIEKHN